VLVADMGARGAHISTDVTSAGDALYFTAFRPDTGRELWRSDGTDAGTGLVREIVAGPEDGSPDSLTAVNGTLFFTASVAEHGFEVWSSDGTAAGTAMVQDINQGPADGVEFACGCSIVHDVDGFAFFTANDGITGDELWSTRRPVG
jgi:ELWxxDGT repeat protein